MRRYFVIHYPTQTNLGCFLAIDEIAAVDEMFYDAGLQHVSEETRGDYYAVEALDGELAQ